MTAPRSPQEVDSIVALWRKLPRRERLRRIYDEHDPTLLGAFVRRSTGVERMQAIDSLGKTGSSQAEPYLIDILRTTTDPFAVSFANAALGRVGTQAAVPELARLIHERAEDVKTSAIAALTQLGDASLTPVFLDALGDRSWVVKWYAMAAIHRHGNDRAIPAVADRVRRILARTRRTNIGGWSELMYGLDFLRRWSKESDDAAATLAWAAGRTARFSEPERVWFRQAFE